MTYALWNGEKWIECDYDSVRSAAPEIVCKRWMGTGALSPSVTIAVGAGSRRDVEMAHDKYRRMLQENK